MGSPTRTLRQAHRTPPTCGDIPKRLFDLIAVAVMQQLVKRCRGLEHKSHALMEVGQVGHEAVVQANGVSIIEAMGHGFTHGVASCSLMR
ncbi:hypothetical protein D3C78_1806820 [compost metagenome]